MKAYAMYGKFNKKWHEKQWIAENLKKDENLKFHNLAVPDKRNPEFEEISIGWAVYFYGGRGALLRAFGCPEIEKGVYDSQKPQIKVLALLPKDDGTIDWRDRERLVVLRGKVRAGVLDAKTKQIIAIVAVKESQLQDKDYIKRELIPNGGNSQGIYDGLKIWHLCKYFEELDK